MGFFKNIIEGFKDSLIDLRLEADLKPIDKGDRPTGKGEIVFLCHTRGHISMQFDIVCFKNIPSEKSLSLYINNKHSMDIKTKNSSAKYSINSKKGDEVPLIQVGDRAEIRCDEEALLIGKFEKD